MNIQFSPTRKKEQTDDRLKVISRPPLIKCISWILIIASLNLFSGCMNYFKVRKASGPTAENINSLNNQNKDIILHLDDKAWQIVSVNLNKQSLNAIIDEKYQSVLNKPVKTEGANRYKTKGYFDQSRVLNEVHIYTTEFSRSPDHMGISVPLKSIQKIEVYEKDKAATVGSWTLGILGGAAAAYLILGIIVILTKSSCPFIYTYDGEQYALAGEIYSGSIQPQLERNDYLKLPANNPQYGKYQIKIANEVKEIQHTNLMEMWVFDYSADVKIWVDKYGKYHTVKNLLSPLSAIGFDGTDHTGLIEKKDSLIFTGTLSDEELRLTDGLIMEFPKPDKAKNAKVVIRAKNSFVLDYMIGQFQNQFGNLYKKWNKKQRRVPESQLRQWKIDQNIPLTLSVERNGRWEKIDYFHVIGPMAFKEDILSFPLTGTENSPMKIKLEAGNFFWDIDYVGMDFSEDQELNYQVVNASSAINQSGEDIHRKIQSDDKKYYIQPEVGDNAVITFELPEKGKESRSIFLHSKGWYHILRDPSGTPDREYLESFRQPGRFNRFVNEYMQSMAVQ